MILSRSVMLARNLHRRHRRRHRRNLEFVSKIGEETKKSKVK